MRGAVPVWSERHSKQQQQTSGANSNSFLLSIIRSSLNSSKYDSLDICWLSIPFNDNGGRFVGPVPRVIPFHQTKRMGVECVGGFRRTRYDRVTNVRFIYLLIYLSATKNSDNIMHSCTAWIFAFFAITFLSLIYPIRYLRVVPSSHQRHNLVIINLT